MCKLLLITLLSFVFISPLDISATGFQTEPFDTFSVDEFSERIGFQQKDVETADLSICAFDVGENGLIALCKRNPLSHKKVVDVYTSDGEFLYGYVFETSGGAIFAEWNDNVLNIVISKSNIVMTIGDDGEIIALERFDETKDNRKYQAQLNDDIRQLGEVTYKIDGEYIFTDFFGYSKLIRTDENDAETILYDVTSAYIVKIILIILFAAVLLTVFSVVFYRKLRGGN